MFGSIWEGLHVTLGPKKLKVSFYAEVIFCVLRFIGEKKH